MCAVQARSPLNLSHLGLTSAALPNLSPFKSVTVLNLSHNKLTTLDGSGIGGMASLKRLDLQHNLLEYVSPGPKASMPLVEDGTLWPTGRPCR
jgi:Leucine-rich repeat (LRR) protein